MILNIFNDIWNKLVEITNEFYKFIMNHFDDPIFWIVLFVILLAIAIGAIANLSDK